MASYLYSKRVWFVISALALMIGLGAAQSRTKESGPRALAIAEFPKDPKASPRLIPIAIRDKGRFFDASVYQANPRPLAVDPGVVYEAERAGEPVGFVTVEGARQVNGEWVALGRWQVRGEEKPASKHPSEPGPAYRDADDSPPVLRRGSSAPAEKKDSTQPTQQPKSAAPEQKTAKKSDDDIPAPDTDPNRPRLRRGKPPSVEHEDAEFEAPHATVKGAPTAAATVQNATGSAPASPAFKEVLVAISDAGGPRAEPFDFRWTPLEQQQATKKLGSIASLEVVAYAKSKPGLKAPPAATFDQVELRAYDLTRNNNPVIIFTGRVPGGATRGKGPAPADYFYYVTVVVQQGAEGEMHKLFSSVTDTGHLDAFPRLEFIDAVDAEGTGYGDLLFRAITDTGRSFQLYRVTRDRLWKLFEGGSGAV
ncbi:MAG: hypothetical protein JO187_13750 [Acidobacteria bacterium]|nr:hypothetical protein [Acidobacteriota bacterium]